METNLELLSAARVMNKDALVEIFDLYAAPLYRYALRLCGDPVIADQVVGDVFAKLLDQFSSGNGPQSNLRSYLYEVTHHQIINEARTSRRSVSLEVADWLGQPTDSELLSPENQILFKEILDAICNELTSDQRHVIFLRIFEDFSLRETAAIIGKTADHVKVIQSRAIAKLRRASRYKETQMNSKP